MHYYKLWNEKTGAYSETFNEVVALKKYKDRGGAGNGWRLIPMGKPSLTADEFSFEETYKTDSGMGGTFLLKYVEFAGGKFKFKIITPGFERIVSYSREEALNKIQKVGK